MNALLAKLTGLKLAELKWHALGILGVIVLLVVGAGFGWQTHVVAVAPVTTVGGLVPVVPPVSSAPAAPAAVGDMLPEKNVRGSAGLRVWEASPEPVIDNTIKSLTPEVWKISGVYANSEGHSVILEFPARQASEYVKQGGELPNGAKVLAVGEHSVTLKTKVANQWKTIVLDLDADNF